MLFKILPLLFLVTLSSAFAAKPPEPKVDYSADSSMEAESMKMNYKVYASPGKHRHEMSDGEMVSIIRKDKNVIWQLMPGNMYMEMSMAKMNPNDPENMDIEKTVVGPETLNGLKTTKYKVIATTKDGKKFGGFFWITPEEITVKSDMLLKDGTEKTRISMELKNLKIGKQNPALFEIPKGYQKVSMGGMDGMSGMMPGGKKKKGGMPGMPNMQDMMKDLSN